MKTLLIDDEPLPRAELRRMLQKFPIIEVVGEASNTDEARVLIALHKPDLLLLDIQMPGETGLEFLASLDAVPHVIFITAYDRHALEAFDLGAADYLLKPVQEERLRLAIERVQEDGADADETSTENQSDSTVTPLTPDQRVLLRDGERSWFVAVSTILAAEACGNYSRVHLAKDAPMISRSLSFLERRLPDGLFFRASRSWIVNLQAIVAVEPWFSGGLKLRLQNGTEVVISRRQAREFRDRMSL